MNTLNMTNVATHNKKIIPTGRKKTPAEIMEWAEEEKKKAAYLKEYEKNKKPARPKNLSASEEVEKLLEIFSEQLQAKIESIETKIEASKTETKEEIREEIKSLFQSELIDKIVSTVTSRVLSEIKDSTAKEPPKGKSNVIKKVEKK